VVGSPLLGAGDAAVRDRLAAAGYAVTVVDDGVSAASDAAGKELLAISSTVSSSLVGSRFRDVAVPAVVWEGGLFDDMGMAPTGSGSYGEPPGQTSIVIADAGHPLAAGLTGTRAVTTSAQTLKWARPGATATKAATMPGDASQATIFGYEAGASMPGTTAPARRAATFLHDTTAGTLTADGRTLLDATLAWAAG
jgi:hypothetical protein